MKIVSVTFGAWTVCILALLAWALIGFSVWSISNAKMDRISEDMSAEERVAEAEAALRLHALARNTKEERALLETFADVGIVSMVETLEKAGQDAGVALEIGQVVADTALPSASPAAPTIRPIVISVRAQGTFPRLFHLVELLHLLPVPSSIEQIQFEHLPDGVDPKKGEWQLSARIRILTIAAISS